MIEAGQLINDQGISAIALAFFTAMFGGLALIFQQNWDSRKKAKEARDAAVMAQKNTENVSNGFASGVDRKLDRIIVQQSDLETALREHLQWHTEHPPRKW